MNSITLQVPINKSVRDQATLKAEKMGFSSLQEVIRLFLNKIATGEVNFRFEEAIQLSPKAIKRYDKMIDEIESRKAQIASFTDVGSLMKHLNEN